MNAMIKLVLSLAAIFATSFLIAKSTGLFSIDQIEEWLQNAQRLSPIYVGSIVAAVLFADLFIAVPTLTVTILAGYFLGFPAGTIAALVGTMMAGVIGYGISHQFGDKVMKIVSKDPEKIQQIKTTFHEHGFVMILLSRAAPIVPEISACLAGFTRMPFSRFITAWTLCTVPYVMIAAYAGSVSTLSDPKPAIFAAIGISGTLWIAWYFFRRKTKSAL